MANTALFDRLVAAFEQDEREDRCRCHDCTAALALATLGLNDLGRVADAMSLHLDAAEFFVTNEAVRGALIAALTATPELPTRGA